MLGNLLKGQFNHHKKEERLAFESSTLWVSFVRLPRLCDLLKSKSNNEPKKENVKKFIPFMLVGVIILLPFPSTFLLYYLESFH